MPQLPISLTIFLGAATAVFSLLYLREYWLRRRAASEQQKVSVETKQKSIQLLNAAQMAETEVIGMGKYATEKLSAEFKTHFEKLIKDSETEITASQDQLIGFMKDLQKRSLDFEEASRLSTERRISQLFERLEVKLSDFLVQTETKTASSIELELKAARELIETYKAQQLKLIDENVVAMMEQTINIVLGKKLSLTDQLDLIYEALEKAKIEKFIV